MSRFGASVVPSKGVEGGLVALMCGSWPDDLDGSDWSSLDTRSSVVSHVVLAHKDFDRTRHAKHDSRLVHVVHILYQNELDPRSRDVLACDSWSHESHLMTYK